MNLTHRETRGIILLLLLVTAVTAVTTCGGGAERAPVPDAAEQTGADAFVLDSMRLVETVHGAAQKKHAVARDTVVPVNQKHGRSGRKQRGLNTAAPVPPRRSPLDEPVAR